MKEIKKNTADFQGLDASQMKKINGGGYWLVIKDKDGKTIERRWIV